MLLLSRENPLVNTVAQLYHGIVAAQQFVGPAQMVKREVIAMHRHQADSPQTEASGPAVGSIWDGSVFPNPDNLLPGHCGWWTDGGGGRLDAGVPSMVNHAVR